MANLHHDIDAVFETLYPDLTVEEVALVEPRARRVARHPGRAIAVVTHLGVLRVLAPGLVLPNAGTVALCPRTFAVTDGAAPSAPPTARPAGQEGRP